MLNLYFYNEIKPELTSSVNTVLSVAQIIEKYARRINFNNIVDNLIKMPFLTAILDFSF